MSYKLGIVGSRVFTSKAGQVWNKNKKNPKQFAFDQLDAYVAKHGKPSLVISGGAKGAGKFRFPLFPPQVDPPSFRLMWSAPKTE